MPAVPDSLIYRVRDLEENLNVHFNGVNFSFVLNDDNMGYWFYKPADDYRYALRNFDDSKWKLFNSDFEIEDADSTFQGIAWLRLHYKVSRSLAGQTLMLRITHNGASEIFNDNKFLMSFGKVSANPEEEIGRDPRNTFFALTVNDTLPHVLAVRYSNANYRMYEEQYGKEEVGFTLRFFHFADVEEIDKLSDYQRFFFIGISTFLFALALVHFMIYLFERSRKFNLYHSIFTLCLASLFLFPVLNKVIESPLASFRLYYYSDGLIPTFFISVLTLLYSLFQKKFNKFYYACLIFYVGALVMNFAFDNWSGFFYVSLFFMMYIGSIIISIKAIRRNFRGAKIVGFGVLGVTLFLVLAIVSLIIFHDSGLVLAIIFMILGILSLPLSMSIYLAYDFAGANKTLQEQIVQIEDLSAKAIREEKEKKLILENQNQMLEEQVKERTREITGQKEIIEEKNKDITDSINYAKRIQDAILVSREVKYRLFPYAFVLFKPKDIVSGDFYWFGGHERKRLIAACDCTGHGVPGALMSMIGNNLLNQIVNEKAITEPSRILTELDGEMRKTLKKDDNPDSKDGMDVALLSFTSENEVQYAGANRPLWIISKGKLEEIKATKISIGGDRYGEDFDFKNHAIQLQSGDTVYIASDGFADQFNNDDKKLMTRRFKEILLSIQHLTMPEQEKYLDDFIEKWKGALEQTDDILVIGIRV